MVIGTAYTHSTGSVDFTAFDNKRVDYITETSSSTLTLTLTYSVDQGQVVSINGLGSLYYIGDVQSGIASINESNGSQNTEFSVRTLEWGNKSATILQTIVLDYKNPTADVYETELIFIKLEGDDLRVMTESGVWVV